ncbi:MAG: hypothetical protein JXR94_18340 [Candidatus Hydrogenedentes bacterium]|nr:hypothetical protein [Candidatus Hydrogenedentota bacterium]
MSFVSLTTLALAGMPGPACTLDLTEAVIVARGDAAPPAERTAALVLAEEVEKRTGLRWPVQQEWPSRGAAIAVIAGDGAALHGREVPARARTSKHEGYGIATDAADPARPVLWIVGADPRGALFGVGRLLRGIECRAGAAVLPAPIELATAPAYPIRGHQLGFRATANSYDAWDLAQYEQYIRELAFFGVNCIENIPLQDSSSPVMKVSREAVNRGLGEICNRYDLDYWVWTPATFDLADEARRAAFLDENEAFYADCPRLDAVFFPGGDPGSNHPKDVMPFLDALAERLARHHPDARIWISLQGFDAERVDCFYDWIDAHRPEWMGGVVAGPSSPPIPETRARLPERYGLRHYPDITHTVRCQYPTPWWDPAFSFTLGREPANPEPIRYARVHNHFAPYTDGFLTYSDGIHDDVNKVVWSVRGWDPAADVRGILIEYARVFFGPDAAEAAADGILALERNWAGPLAENGGVDAALALWQGLERENPSLAGNWRWQLCLLRAYYDTYTRHRLLYETQLEREADEALIAAAERGAAASGRQALAILARADGAPCRPELRERIDALCAALFDSIGLQTSVERYHASGAERGAVLDFVDHPLNNRWWLEDEIGKALAMDNEAERVARLTALGAWEDAGPGGYYDDIGNVARSPRVLHGEGLDTDPNMERNPNPGCMWWDGGRSRTRHSWITYMDWPLGLRYEGLDPGAAYLVRTTGYRDCLLRVNGERIAPSVNGTGIGEIKEFPVPKHLYRDGVILLTFDQPHEPGLNWRVTSRLTEVWLIRR